jgi:inner membrane transporter RhtA
MCLPAHTGIICTPLSSVDDDLMSARSSVAPKLLAVAALMVSMSSYQFGAAIAKQLFPLVGAQGATAYRLGLGGLIMLLVRRPWRAFRNGNDATSLWAYGLSMGAMNLSFYMALRTIPLGLAVAIEFAGPMAIALFASRRVLDFVWIILAAIGLLLLLPLRGEVHALDPIGVMYALFAGAGWALYIVFGQKAGAAYGADAVSLGIAMGALIAVPTGFIHTGSALLSPALLPMGIGVAILSSILPYSLEMVALTRLPTRTFSVLLSLEPVIAALVGAALLSERLNSLQWVAITAIVIASAGAALSARLAITEPLID